MLAVADRLQGCTTVPIKYFAVAKAHNQMIKVCSTTKCKGPVMDMHMWHSTMAYMRNWFPYI